MVKIGAAIFFEAERALFNQAVQQGFDGFRMPVVLAASASIISWAVTGVRLQQIFINSHSDSEMRGCLLMRL